MNGKEIKKAVDISARAGTILLRSGADITRVEDTINHMMRAFGVVRYDIFTITNGIFLSATPDDAPEGTGDYTRICDVPKNSSDLGKVDMVNTLSRDIEAGLCDLDGAEARLDEIERVKGYPVALSLFAAALAAGTFSYLFGGSLFDAVLAATCGLAYYPIAMKLGGTRLSKLLTNGICGFILALLSVCFFKLLPGVNLDKVIIGAIMPLIPGVSFVNSVRDIAAGDYISGTIRMIDAIVTAAGIALGVGLTILIFSRLGVI
jgi:uncharacterized membrane protein YjjP (DUF1212 family)